MKLSKEGADLIKSFEGCHLESYLCPANVWTIGYGHTLGVEPNMKITQKEADTLFDEDIAKFEKYANELIKVPVSQGMFDALTSIVYNCGYGAIKNSTLVKLLNKFDYIGASNEFLKWNKSNGQILLGLKVRRRAEKDLFDKEIDKYVKTASESKKTEVVKSEKVKCVDTFSLKTDGEYQIAKNFKVKEFACKDKSDKILIDTDFVVNFLQKVRDHFGKPIVLNSAYRTESYNKKIGGASKSYHVQGRAFDIAIDGVTPNEVAKYCQSLGIKGIIQYNTFTHIDSRDVKYWAKNDNGKVTVVNNF